MGLLNMNPAITGFWDFLDRLVSETEVRIDWLDEHWKKRE